MKLNHDGYIHYGHKEDQKERFKISIDGCIAKERNGYRGKHRRELFERHSIFEKIFLLLIGSILAVGSNVLIFKKPRPTSLQLLLQKDTATHQAGSNIEKTLRGSTKSAN